MRESSQIMSCFFSGLTLISSLSEWVKVAQSCPTFCDPVDCTVHGILQARILEWVTFSFSRDLPNPGIKPRSPTLQADSLPAEPQGSPRILEWVAYPFSSRSTQPRNQTGISCIAGGFFTNWAMREAPISSLICFISLITIFQWEWFTLNEFFYQ